MVGTTKLTLLMLVLLVLVIPSNVHNHSEKFLGLTGRTQPKDNVLTQFQSPIITKINASDALIYSIAGQGSSDGAFRYETFDPILHSRISGLKGTTQSKSQTNGSSILRTRFVNSTQRVVEASFITWTQTNSSTDGEEYKRSIFGSDWEDASETENTITRDNSTNLWIGKSNGTNWLNLEDQVIASISSYSAINATEFDSGDQEMSLSGIEDALNFTSYSWVKEDTTIKMPQIYRNRSNSEQAILHQYYNFSSRIYRDETDDIFDNVPYNITRSLKLDILEDPQSHIYLLTNIQLYFHIDFKAQGKVKDSGLGSLVDAKIDLDLSTRSNTTYSLIDYIVPRQNDNHAPQITEKWTGDLPEQPSWKVNDSGFINISILIDNRLTRTQVFLNEGELGYNLNEVEWNNLTILAIDEFNNTNSLFYDNPQTWQPSDAMVSGIIVVNVLILLIVSSVVLKINIFKRKPRN